MWQHLRCFASASPRLLRWMAVDVAAPALHRLGFASAFALDGSGCASACAASPRLRLGFCAGCVAEPAIKEGAGVRGICDAKTSMDTLRSPDEKEKRRLRRLETNRETAQKSRDRAKNGLQLMKAQLVEQAQEIARLRSENERLRSERAAAGVDETLRLRSENEQLRAANEQLRATNDAYRALPLYSTESLDFSLDN
jgi:septal ring factor EnvC (AmiA/AmiB activator)